MKSRQLKYIFFSALFVALHSATAAANQLYLSVINPSFIDYGTHLGNPEQHKQPYHLVLHRHNFVGRHGKLEKWIRFQNYMVLSKLPVGNPTKRINKPSIDALLAGKVSPLGALLFAPELSFQLLQARIKLWTKFRNHWLIDIAEIRKDEPFQPKFDDVFFTELGKFDPQKMQEAIEQRAQKYEGLTKQYLGALSIVRDSIKEFWSLLPIESKAIRVAQLRLKELEYEEAEISAKKEALSAEITMTQDNLNHLRTRLRDKSKIDKSYSKEHREKSQQVRQIEAMLQLLDDSVNKSGVLRNGKKRDLHVNNYIKGGLEELRDRLKISAEYVDIHVEELSEHRVQQIAKKEGSIQESTNSLRLEIKAAEEQLEQTQATYQRIAKQQRTIDFQKTKVNEELRKQTANRKKLVSTIQLEISLRKDLDEALQLLARDQSKFKRVLFPLAHDPKLLEDSLNHLKHFSLRNNKITLDLLGMQASENHLPLYQEVLSTLYEIDKTYEFTIKRGRERKVKQGRTTDFRLPTQFSYTTKNRVSLMQLKATLQMRKPDQIQLETYFFKELAQLQKTQSQLQTELESFDTAKRDELVQVQAVASQGGHIRNLLGSVLAYATLLKDKPDLEPPVRFAFVQKSLDGLRANEKVFSTASKVFNDKHWGEKIADFVSSISRDEVLSFIYDPTNDRFELKRGKVSPLLTKVYKNPSIDFPSKTEQMPFYPFGSLISQMGFIEHRTPNPARVGHQLDSDQEQLADLFLNSSHAQREKARMLNFAEENLASGQAKLKPLLKQDLNQQLSHLYNFETLSPKYPPAQADHIYGRAFVSEEGGVDYFLPNGYLIKTNNPEGVINEEAFLIPFLLAPDGKTAFAPAASVNFFDRTDWTMYQANKQFYADEDTGKFTPHTKKQRSKKQKTRKRALKPKNPVIKKPDEIGTVPEWFRALYWSRRTAELVPGQEAINSKGLVPADVDQIMKDQIHISNELFEGNGFSISLTGQPKNILRAVYQTEQGIENGYAVIENNMLILNLNEQQKEIENPVEEKLFYLIFRDEDQYKLYPIEFKDSWISNSKTFTQQRQESKENSQEPILEKNSRELAPVFLDDQPLYEKLFILLKDSAIDVVQDFHPNMIFNKGVSKKVKYKFFPGDMNRVLLQGVTKGIEDAFDLEFKLPLKLAYRVFHGDEKHLPPAEIIDNVIVLNMSMEEDSERTIFGILYGLASYLQLSYKQINGQTPFISLIDSLKEAHPDLKGFRSDSSRLETEIITVLIMSVSLGQTEYADMQYNILHHFLEEALTNDQKKSFQEADLSEYIVSLLETSNSDKKEEQKTRNVRALVLARAIQYGFNL